MAGTVCPVVTAGAAPRFPEETPVPDERMRIQLDRGAGAVPTGAVSAAAAPDVDPDAGRVAEAPARVVPRGSRREGRGVRPAPPRRDGRRTAPGRTVLLAAALAAVPPAACAPGDRQDAGVLPPTRAERTGYEQTTGYGEVVQFVTLAADRSERIHATTFGSTAEGRPLPLAVVGDTADARPASVVGAGRLRVWLQGAVHGGEVAGKEALLMLLRDLAAGGHAEWSSSLVLLVAPVCNADGHERMGPDTRPYQLGPVAGAGERTNAQGLDLNRDHVKLESPEARALVRAYAAWDPHVVIDLHTTNGTEHAYHLTYAPPLHPNTHPGVDALLRGEWLPAISRAVERTDGWRFYYYGNLPFAAGAEPGWRTFDHRPRFNNNYVGLRNRIALLGEAYAYAPFDERIRASLRFVEEALAFAHERADAIAALVERADADPVAGTRLATRAVPAPPDGPVEILLGRTEEVLNPYTRAPMRRRLDVAEPTRMYEYGAFTAADDGRELAPAAYYVPAGLTAVVDLLAAHGVEGAPLAADTTLPVQEFVVRTSSVAGRPFQGHRERVVTGAWTPVERLVPAGALVVPVAQPLGRLVFTLLEPRSDDGVVNWNLVDDHVGAAGSVYPILRRPAEPGPPRDAPGPAPPDGAR